MDDSRVLACPHRSYRIVDEMQGSSVCERLHVHLHRHLKLHLQWRVSAGKTLALAVRAAVVFMQLGRPAIRLHAHHYYALCHYALALLHVLSGEWCVGT